MRRSIAAVGLAVSVATAASAEEVSYYDRFELWNDCQPISLHVTPLSQDADDIGLTGEAIETAVRSRLRAARLYDPDSWMPHLFVGVHVVGSAFGLDPELYKLVNDPLPGTTGGGSNLDCGTRWGWRLYPVRRVKGHGPLPRRVPAGEHRGVPARWPTPI